MLSNERLYMNKINQFVVFLQGKKTHIVAASIALLNVAVALGYVDEPHLAQINAVLVALGLSALRAGVKKA